MNTALSWAHGHVKTTAIKAMQPQRETTLIKIETDARIAGYGPGGGTGPFARAVIEGLEGPRLSHLGLIGKDLLSIFTIDLVPLDRRQRHG